MAEVRYPPTNIFLGGDSASVLDVLRGLDKNQDGGNLIIESEFDSKESEFGYASSSPKVIASVIVRERVDYVAIKIVDPFDGDGATLSIGHSGDPNALLPSSYVFPNEIGIYEVTPHFKYGGSEDIKLYINRSGSTKGSGVVYINTDRNDI